MDNTGCVDMTLTNEAVSFYYVNADKDATDYATRF